MINRDKHTVTVKRLTNNTDSFGQIVPGTPFAIEAAVYTYTQSNVQDPRFVDVELVCVTKDDIVEGDIVQTEEGEFMVKYVMNAKRFKMAHLVKQS